MAKTTIPAIDPQDLLGAKATIEYLNQYDPRVTTAYWRWLSIDRVWQLVLAAGRGLDEALVLQAAKSHLPLVSAGNLRVAVPYDMVTNAVVDYAAVHAYDTRGRVSVGKTYVSRAWVHILCAGPETDPPAVAVAKEPEPEPTIPDAATTMAALRTRRLAARQDRRDWSNWVKASVRGFAETLASASSNFESSISSMEPALELHRMLCEQGWPATIHHRHAVYGGRLEYVVRVDLEFPSASAVSPDTMETEILRRSASKQPAKPPREGAQALHRFNDFTSQWAGVEPAAIRVSTRTEAEWLKLALVEAGWRVEIVSAHTREHYLPDVEVTPGTVGPAGSDVLVHPSDAMLAVVRYLESHTDP